MSYDGGRHSVYVDLTTDKDSYVTATYDAMTQPLVTWLCNLFGMVVFNDLTEETDKGHRYYIGYTGDEYPSYIIGWASANTNTRYRWLYIVGTYEGTPLNSVLDTAGTGTLSTGQFHKQLLIRDFESQNYDHTYINYVKDDNIVGITNCYGSSSSVVSSNNTMDFMVFKTGTKKLRSFRSNNIYGTYDFTNNGLFTNINPTNIYFVNLKNVIANSDFNYICQVRLPHNAAVTDFFIYSAALTLHNVYKINGEYYICLTTSNTDGSYLAKLPNYTP